MHRVKVQRRAYRISKEWGALADNFGRTVSLPAIA